ncbi:MAG: hypothetical protein WBG37_18350 [Desulfobacterales bacterium]|jgi:hypothetical protein
MRHLPWIATISLLLAVNGAWAAGPKVKIDVKTVLASQSNKGVDGRLKAMTRELNSVFRYSSYQLLSQSRMVLNLNETGRAQLPGNRALTITPTRILGNRVELKMAIFRKKQQQFATVFQLLNHGSMIVGGPRHDKGHLLFNISGSY